MSVSEPNSHRPGAAAFDSWLGAATFYSWLGAAAFYSCIGAVDAAPAGQLCLRPCGRDPSGLSTSNASDRDGRLTLRALELWLNPLGADDCQ